MGKKMVPILEKDDDSIMAESNDIIRYFLQQKMLMN
ncbi:glutathione S-transferase N-terminal domain-containing protein [Pseudoalteromonas sp. B193]